MAVVVEPGAGHHQAAHGVHAPVAETERERGDEHAGRQQGDRPASANGAVHAAVQLTRLSASRSMACSACRRNMVVSITSPRSVCAASIVAMTLITTPHRLLMR